MKKHLATITEKGINIKSFWKFIKAFLTNKDLLGSNDISLGKKNVVTTNVKALVNLNLNAYKNDFSIKQVERNLMDKTLFENGIFF